MNNLALEQNRLWLARQLAYSRLQRKRIEKIVGKVND